MTMPDSESNFGESLQEPESGSDALGEFVSGGENEDLSSFDDDDSSTEMVLIAESFKRTNSEPLTATPTEYLQLEMTEKEVESTGISSQDVTLFEVRDRLSGQQSQGKIRTKK